MSEETRVTITLPALGEGVTEGTISRWLVAAGDTVAVADPILEVSTDKVDTEVPSTHEGTIVEVLIGEDEVVEVGGALAVLAVSVATSPAPTTRPEPEPAAAAPEPPAPAATEPTGAAPAPLPTTAGDGSQTAPRSPEKLPRIRQVIAARMLESLRSTAQLTSFVEADVTNVGHLRNALKFEFHEQVGIKLSYLPFFAKAAIEALAEHPVLNATVNADCTEITYVDGVNLGIAVDSPKGLMVPVIANAHRCGIADLAVEIDTLAQQVRTGSITPDALTGGSFTLTNTGSRGALFDTPILNMPQSGILGTGAVVERVVPQRDSAGNLAIGVRAMVYLALTYDHRIVDGADAARFLAAVRQRLEGGFTPDEVLSSPRATAS